MASNGGELRMIFGLHWLNAGETGILILQRIWYLQSYFRFCERSFLYGNG